MSTFVIPVDKKQKKVLKPILEYLNLSFSAQKHDIEKGLADAIDGKTKPLKEVLDKYR